MQYSSLLAWAAAVATSQAAYIGFNYGSTFSNGSSIEQAYFEAEFNRAKSLQGTNGEFTSARLYTMIQGGTTDTPISAIPAAIDTQTSLLLGLWASAGQADFDNELTALTSAIEQYGTDFTSLIVGISVGSEDLYRNSVTGAESDAGAGAQPSDIVSYISQVRSAISGTSASGASVGHVDTWTAWVNGSNDAVISAVDWLGMDAYPYFQNTEANGIDVANSTFFQAYDNTVGVAGGKSVWVTETGWPVSGPTENDAVASTANAEIYWQQTGCSLFGEINTWWYILQDAEPDTPSPSFGLVPADLDSAPLYNLTCSSDSAAASAASSSSSSKSSSAVSTASSASAPSSSAAANTESVTQATPGPESSPATATISLTTATSAAQSASVASGSAVSSKASSSAPASSASSAPASSASSAASSSAPASSASSSLKTSYITSTAPASGSVGSTYTIRSTTLVTITSCSGGCSESVTTISPSAGQTTVVTIGGSSQTGTSAASNSSCAATGCTSCSPTWTNFASGSTSASAVSSSPSASSGSGSSKSAASSPVTVGTASPTAASSSATTAAAPSGTACPANLNGEYQYPHLIVPVNSSAPTTAYGTQYNGTITPTVSTIFNFDLPASYSGKTCSLVFLFPEQSALETSAYTFNGEGGINVNELSSAATQQTTYNTVPAAAVSGIGSIPSLQSGNSYVVASHECAAGSTVSFEFVSTGGLSLEYFEDFNPSPLGAYITVC